MASMFPDAGTVLITDPVMEVTDDDGEWTIR
jgi:hypothetical protein